MPIGRYSSSSIGEYEEVWYNEQYLDQQRYVLKTGGQAFPGQQNLWVIWASANEESIGTFDEGPAIPPSQITVAGQTLDANGNAYLALPNNAEVDITPMAPGNYTFSGPSPTEYQPQIQANGITLDPVKINATFCVGQQITFTLNLPVVYCNNGPLVNFKNVLCTWKFQGNFVNSIIPNPPGSTIYTNNGPIVTTNGPCTNWYFNGPGGTVNVGANLILPNGKSVSVAALGQFAIERPSVSLPTNEILEPRHFSITSNLFGGATIKLGTPGQQGDGEMGYTVQCETDYGGMAMLTQTCQLRFNPDSGGFNFSDWRLDGSTNYAGPTGIRAEAVPVDFPTLDDGPQNGTLFSTSSIEVKGNFMDYIMFEPTNTTGSIYVTLGVVTWNIDGLITNAPSGWMFVITNTPNPVLNPSADQFPFYTQPQ